jgi:hypothetical protein
MERSVEKCIAEKETVLVGQDHSLARDLLSLIEISRDEGWQDVLRKLVNIILHHTILFLSIENIVPLYSSSND